MFFMMRTAVFLLQKVTCLRQSSSKEHLQIVFSTYSKCEKRYEHCPWI